MSDFPLTRAAGLPITTLYTPDRNSEGRPNRMPGEPSHESFVPAADVEAFIEMLAAQSDSQVIADIARKAKRDTAESLLRELTSYIRDVAQVSSFGPAPDCYRRALKLLERVELAKVRGGG